jgi:acyl-CoA synthetase (AMP-forming)/AMP-acid ligase II/acyl carrier protein
MEEKRKILAEFNNTGTDYPREKTIHALFEEQVERIPDRIAVLGRGPTRTNTDNNVPIYVTYKKLNKISDCLAGLLIEKGFLADDIAAIKIDRSLEMIVGVMGILKTGAVYLPIDMAYPQERIDYMLKDSPAKILLTAAERVFNLHHSSFDLPRIHHSKLYRTGDLARWLEDGNIEFLGRIDQQVKIRGFRIEVEEIENNMSRHPGVKEVKVLDKTDNKGDKYLCAYIVSGRLITGSEFKEYLSGCLPGYMIPTSFVLLDRIPLTINGKVDRKAFPEPEITPGGEYIAPGNEIEEQIAFIWSEVLGIEKNKLSVNTNFFDLGGHSLKIMIMVARIHKVFNLKLELIQIFQNPTIRSIASLIEAFQWVNDQEPGSDINGEHESEEIIL